MQFTLQIWIFFGFLFPHFPKVGSTNDYMEQKLCVQERGILRFSRFPQMTENSEVDFQSLSLNNSYDMTSVTFFHNHETLIILNVSTNSIDFIQDGMKIKNSKPYDLEFTLVEVSNAGNYTRLLTFENGGKRIDTTTLFVEDPCLRVIRSFNCTEWTCLTSPGGSMTFGGKELKVKTRSICGVDTGGVVQCCTKSGNCKSSVVNNFYMTQTVCASSNVTMDVNFGFGLDGKIVGGPLITYNAIDGERKEIFVNFTKNRLRGMNTGRILEIVSLYKPRLSFVQKSDEGVYVIRIKLEKDGKTFMENTITMFFIQDPCFRKAEFSNETQCLEMECLTSVNGSSIYNGLLQSSKKASVCNKSQNGVYDCCSPTNECLSQRIIFQGPEMEKNTSTGATKSSKTVYVVSFSVASALVVVIVVIALVMFSMKYKTSRFIANDIYLGVDGRNTANDPYAIYRISVQTTMDADEDYAYLQESEMCTDGQILTLYHTQAESKPYEAHLNVTTEDDYDMLGASNTERNSTQGTEQVSERAVIDLGVLSPEIDRRRSEEIPGTSVAVSNGDEIIGE